jgi:hypothetical protein
MPLNKKAQDALNYTPVADTFGKKSAAPSATGPTTPYPKPEKTRLVYQIKDIHTAPQSQVFDDETTAKQAGAFLLNAAVVMQRQWIIAPVISKVNPIEEAGQPTITA